MSTRRSFIKNIGIHSAALSLIPQLPYYDDIVNGLSIPDLPLDGSTEDFWSVIQQSYTASRSLINLNNGGVSPQPKFVQEAFKLYTDLCNEAPSYYMWRQLEPSRENIRHDLANMIGCVKEELVINRNTTEAIDTVIFGLNLTKGDEIVLSNYDYPNMRNAWIQRQQRDGIVLKYADFTLPDDSDDKIIQAFAKQITPKTKLVHITHMVNYNGQVLPAKEISEIAVKNGALVLLDSAHTFSHIPFDVREINCDFMGTSLHKWLCAPFGSGMMYVKKSRISEIWSSYPTDAVTADDIRKFEAMGTRSVPTEIAIGQALLFQNNIGIERKYNRLKELTDYWTEPFLNNPKFISYTPKKIYKYGSLFTFGIKNKTGNDIANHLQKKQSIITSPITWRNIEGCRVSPHIYTTKNELDRLMEGVNELLKN